MRALLTLCILTLTSACHSSLSGNWRASNSGLAIDMTIDQHADSLKNVLLSELPVPTKAARSHPLTRCQPRGSPGRLQRRVGLSRHKLVRFTIVTHLVNAMWVYAGQRRLNLPRQQQLNLAEAVRWARTVQSA